MAENLRHSSGVCFARFPFVCAAQLRDHPSVAAITVDLRGLVRVDELCALALALAAAVLFGRTGVLVRLLTFGTIYKLWPRSLDEAQRDPPIYRGVASRATTPRSIASWSSSCDDLTSWRLPAATSALALSRMARAL